MKQILVVQYSQSGQLIEVLSRLIEPLRAAPDCEVHVLTLRPRTPYPFPWPLLRFFDTFPEAVHLDAPELEPLELGPDPRFDLVILGYQVWFLSPSLPVTAFLKGEAGRRILQGTPVVTVVACRDMWLMAQEQMKSLLATAGARLVGHVALVDAAGTAGSFLATPLWMLTGSRGPRLGGLIPRAGVQQEQIEATRRFGERIAAALKTNAPLDADLLKNLQAVRVNTGLIASERAIRRGLRAWGSLLRGLGPQGCWRRKPALVAYFLWLVLAILLLVPLGFLLKALLGPLRRKRLEAQRTYFGAPSGE